MPYKAGQIAALHSTISAWMRLAIFETMDRASEATSDDEPKRLWFVVDELDALGQIDGLKDALARLRKFGGRCVLGFQSIAQVSSTYGHGEAHTIVENCGNSLILRCSASEGGGTARFASQLIGEREVLRTSVSKSRRATEFWGSTTHSQQFAVESAVLPSQVEQLPDLAGYLKFASEPQWLRVRLDARRAWEQRRATSPDAQARAAPAREAVAAAASGLPKEPRSDIALGDGP
jgi:type IV secretory pathway TraG/TraD family ATPase VirD4